MPRIFTFLTYDDQAEQAARFYVSIFEDAKINKVVRYGDAGPGPKGGVMTVAFELAGQPYVALNGGPQFKFTEGISLTVECKSQDEIDHYWEQLSAGGEKIACGWLRDKFGLYWQVNPNILPEMLDDPDPVKADRVMAAMMKMQKIIIADIQKAYEG